MWRSYRELHEKWQRLVAQAEATNERKTLHRLMIREPQKPFSNGLNHKVPVWFDSAIGSIERSKNIKLCRYVARISTLEKGSRVTLQLNSVRYHLDLLERARSLSSFQIVKRSGKYHVHVKVVYAVPDKSVSMVRGIDLGVKRSIASVTLRPNQPLMSKDFVLVHDRMKVHYLSRLNRRVAELQKAKKWEPLRRVRNRRQNVAEYHDRLSAQRVADTSDGCLVTVGYPRGIRNDNPKGNGKAYLRRLLARWSYGRMIRYIREECNERGIRVEVTRENWSSATCHRCGSRDTERTSQSLFHCWNCGLSYNADFNAAINIGSRFLPEAANRKATAGLA
jgi:transposase